MIDQRRIKELFTYDDGDLIWKVSPGNGSISRIGKRKESRVARTKVDGTYYLTHRLIYAYFYGSTPDMIDHIDGNSLNNKIENLRPCNKSTNGFNAKMSKANKSGVKGMIWNKLNKNWRLIITKHGKKVLDESVKDRDLAEFIISEARDFYHNEFARHA